MLEKLKDEVFRANLRLHQERLAPLTWGNVSGIDRARRHVVIKPSGVAYESMSADDMVVVDMEGTVVEGQLRPSSDLPTHLYLYRHFESIGGAVHTHSIAATKFAQARIEIPCLGTTHADYFYGPVPITRPLTLEEVNEAYEAKTGHVIIERFAALDPTSMPAVLVAGHGPFTWGSTPNAAVEASIALEAVAEMALGTWQLRGDWPVLEDYVLEKHYLRKHGPDAYYGQE